jgi:lysine 2,3-aminomutase
LALMQGLRGTISGLCQPTYVLDIPGGHGKAVLEQTHAQANGADEVRLRDFRGQEHGYRDARDDK